MAVSLGKGIFLIAAPSLRDPNFRQTVVLLCEHGPEGALGVVVNRPTGVSVSEALPQVPVLEGQRHVLFAGGPVQPNHVLLLYRMTQEPGNTHHVFDGVYLGGDVEALERMLSKPAGNGAFRAYMGYSGWGPGQLENEMKTGSWITLPADPTVVFEKEPDRVWPDILQGLGGPYAVYAEMPADPGLN
ncbi:MAG: YqgE/AlgH family protein [Nitrospirota bacterium]|nr:YqgE/AlgH family protein [Nitrospirota bacterium]